MNLPQHRIVGLGIVIALLVSTLGGAGALMPLAGPTSASAAPATPQDTPIQLVTEPYARWILGGGAGWRSQRYERACSANRRDQQCQHYPEADDATM